MPICPYGQRAQPPAVRRPLSGELVRCLASALNVRKPTNVQSIFMSLFLCFICDSLNIAYSLKVRALEEPGCPVEPETNRPTADRSRSRAHMRTRASSALGDQQAHCQRQVGNMHSWHWRQMRVALHSDTARCERGLRCSTRDQLTQTRRSTCKLSSSAHWTRATTRRRRTTCRSDRVATRGQQQQQQQRLWLFRTALDADVTETKQAQLLKSTFFDSDPAIGHFDPASYEHFEVRT